ncbi:DUF2171 domain-containing protein [Sphingomonas piscis]|uniref:DUF2171 domain-containing protein n=1 Tax=Sphingomonas piscis TaxID=2714943 RepID=A0A6G7YND8_9SPHN|nr:DUF2171 domain-containing protein [Sphingomonas piscis]QIK78258.1 DUF2171 domain-containing protein [Sphingomonas piscis]
MGYDRDEADYGRQDRSRWADDRSSPRQGSGRSERGFFERAGDEIASWFGSDDDGGRDSRDGNWDRERGDDRQRGGWMSGEHRDRGNDWRNQERSRANPGRDDRNEWLGGRSPEHSSRDRYDRSQSEERSYRSDHDGDQRGYRPVTGDYGRSSFNDRQQPQRGDQHDKQQSNWDRDDYRRTSFAGSSDRSQHHDPHYRQWRERHMQELDRDYHDYHRERQTRFDDDFGGWRNKRQEKRSLLGQVREHLEVVGSDGEHVGTVDKVAGDRIILTRNDPAAGGHHSIACTLVDRVENGRVILDTTAEQARNRWRDEDRSRALFEREDQGQAGPGILDRSFSGTYRD